MKKKIFWCLGALALALGIAAFIYFRRTRHSYSTVHVNEADGPTAIYISSQKPALWQSSLDKIALGVITVINRFRYDRADKRL